MPGPETVFASIGARWANVANTPYQYAKAQSYEGGVRTPMIAFWPAGIKSKGTFTDCVGHVMDFMPTFLELSGAKYPKTYNGYSITPYSGISLVAALKGNKTAGHATLYNEHYRARYIRDSQWKLVSLANDTTWHLYKIDADETELNDLSAQHPDVVNRLSQQWRSWAYTHQVFPKPG
jgi:arylsulfatase A-like enzyme